MNNKSFFSKTKERKLKPFLISFSVFLVILIGCSIFIFMDSIDYNFDNLVEKEQTETKENETESVDGQYSVSELSGKSHILFVVQDDAGSIDLPFLVMMDFENKTMNVRVVDDKTGLTMFYSKNGEKGLKEYISAQLNTTVDRYVVFENSQFKKFLSRFDGITIDVKNKVDYKSHEFNLLLDTGKQTVSGDIAYKLLLVSDNDTLEYVLCDVINSVLTPKYVDESESLFKAFVNSSSTDISIVDYADKIDKLKIYAYSNEKFMPTPYVAGE